MKARDYITWDMHTCTVQWGNREQGFQGEIEEHGHQLHWPIIWWINFC